MGFVGMMGAKVTRGAVKGASAPCQELSRGCDAADIVNVAAITAIQAGGG